MQPRLKRDISLVLRERHLDARRPLGVRARQAALVDEALALTRVGFVLNPIIVPDDDAVQRARLLLVRGPGPESRPYRAFVLGGDGGLKPAERVARL